jgi:hypothetical protein
LRGVGTEYLIIIEISFGFKGLIFKFILTLLYKLAHLKESRCHKFFLYLVRTSIL